MKNIITILMFISTLVLFYSCGDVADFGNNANKITSPPPSVSKDDSLSFLDLKDIDCGNIHWHRVLYKNISINNLSGEYTVSIYEIKLNNKFGFELYPEHGFPIVILPGQSNADNLIIAKWDTDVITPGSYQDTIFLNGSQKYMLLIRGNVYD
jgi:hypothetical protein